LLIKIFYQQLDLIYIWW